jgi:hypothetical protein
MRVVDNRSDSLNQVRMNERGGFMCPLTRRSTVMCAMLASVMVLIGHRAIAETPPAAEKAVWQVQDMHLNYFGITTHYSCDGIRDRVRAVLDQLGVAAARVTVGACTELSGPSRNPSVRIVAAYPVPATDENLKLIANDPKRGDLLASLQKKSKVAITAEPFDAERLQVVLASKSQSPSSASGDCELLEQMRDQIIKKMGGTVVKDDLRCIPHQGSAGNSRLTVEMLSAKSAS